MKPKRIKQKLREVYASRLAIFLGCILLLTGCRTSGAAPQTTEAAETVEQSETPEISEIIDTDKNSQIGEVVQVCVGDVIGSGVLWEKTDEKLIVVTAGHVFEMGSGEAQVTFPDGLTVVVTSHEVVKPDLAFIVIDADEVQEEQIAQYQTVVNRSESAETEPLQSEDKVVLKPYVTDQEPELLEGTVLNPWIYIEDFKSHMILAEMEVEQGMSGSGLFDCEGHFLGILCGESEDGEIAVVPFVIIQAEYVIISENF